MITKNKEYTISDYEKFLDNEYVRMNRIIYNFESNFVIDKVNQFFEKKIMLKNILKRSSRYGKMRNLYLRKAESYPSGSICLFANRGKHAVYSRRQ